MQFFRGTGRLRSPTAAPSSGAVLFFVSFFLFPPLPPLRWRSILKPLAVFIFYDLRSTDFEEKIEGL